MKGFFVWILSSNIYIIGMNHYLKYISEIIWPKWYEEYLSCRDKPLPKTISLVDFLLWSHDLWKDDKSQIIPLLSQTWVELQKPNIYIPNHYKAEYEREKWWLGNNIYHSLGFFYIQETSAALPATLLDLQKGDVVLDMCASPWGKSVQILDRLNKLGWGVLVSNEIDRSRIDKLKDNVNKFAFANDLIISHDSKYISTNLPKVFDKILVDAPCSGEWTCHRGTRFLDKWSLDLVNKTAKLQLEIINNVYHSLKPGGIMIYSTCTINPIENEWVVARFLDEHRDMSLVDLSDLGFAEWLKWYDLDDRSCDKVVRLLPHIHHTWWFFVAKFVKKAKEAEKAEGVKIAKEAEKTEIGNFKKYIYDKFEIDVSNSNDGYFYQNGENIYYVNGWSEQISQTIYDLNNKIFKSVAGVMVAKIGRKWYILAHAFGKVFGSLTKRCLVYIDNMDILTKLVSDGWCDIDGNARVLWDNNLDNQFIFVKWGEDLNIYIWVGKVLWDWLKFNI